MGLVIGMDEAGYGPNLGPLVLTATVWEVPGRPQAADFWTAFSEIVEQELSEDGDRLHVADSKTVYSPARGLGSLERSVLAALGISRAVPAGFQDLLHHLTGAHDGPDHDGDFLGSYVDELLLAAPDLPLPLSEEGKSAQRHAERWRAICQAKKIRLRAIRCDVVAPRRWNHMTRALNNKATALSRTHLQLLRKVWDPDESGSVMIFADKHGGRNYYAGLLVDCLDGRMVRCARESSEQSIYKIGRSEIRFEAKCERHFPVALASMVSKYVRELTMELFNQFWRSHLPSLKPTRGYPTDSHRFRRDVAEMQARLAIPDDVLWRER